MTIKTWTRIVVILSIMYAGAMAAAERMAFNVTFPTGEHAMGMFTTTREGDYLTTDDGVTDPWIVYHGNRWDLRFTGPFGCTEHECRTGRVVYNMTKPVVTMWFRDLEAELSYGISDESVGGHAQYLSELDFFDTPGSLSVLFPASVGDANLDGRFDSGDLTTVFQAGEYEDGVESGSFWMTGDWDGDREFGTSDLLVAFQDGGYSAAAIAVPEPEYHAGVLAFIFVVLVGLIHKMSLNQE